MTDKQIRDMVLAQAEVQGRTRFKRVSKTFIERVRRRMSTANEQIIRDEVQRHPSLGVTFK